MSQQAIFLLLVSLDAHQLFFDVKCYESPKSLIVKVQEERARGAGKSGIGSGVSFCMAELNSICPGFLLLHVWDIPEGAYLVWHAPSQPPPPPSPKHLRPASPHAPHSPICCLVVWVTAELQVTGAPPVFTSPGWRWASSGTRLVVGSQTCFMALLHKAKAALVAWA